MIRRLGAALLLLVVSCSEVEQVVPPAQAGLLTEDLTFFRFSGDAYQVAEKQGSFWAVRGENRHLVLRYTDTNEAFLKFTVGANSIVDQDSVLISVQVDNEGAIAFHFSPSGLRFNELAPAVLRINHARKNADIDADGDIDLDDSFQSLRTGIWKRELPALPWQKVPSGRPQSTVEQAYVYDFTSFGMAVD